MGDRGWAAVLEHHLSVHLLHGCGGQPAADGVEPLGERGTLAIEDILVDDRRDVLIAEDVLGVAEDCVTYMWAPETTGISLTKTSTLEPPPPPPPATPGVLPAPS